MHTRVAVPLLLLAAGMPAQGPTYNLVVPSGVAFAVTVWNGEAAIALLAPEDRRIAVFLDPTLTLPRMQSVALYPQLLGVFDARACAVGARFELWFSDRHLPWLGGTMPDTGSYLGTSGLHMNVPMTFRAEQPVSTEWYVSYCSIFGCTHTCAPTVNGPQSTLLIATVRLN